MKIITPPISIREFNSNDKEFILDLLRLNTPKYFSFEEEKELENYLSNELEYYCVATIKGQIIGCGGINIKDNESVAYISWDIIHPELQGKGIGKRILKHRIEKLQNNENIEQIIVRTSQYAYKFYEKNGFVIFEIIEDYWAKGFHLYYMKFNL